MTPIDILALLGLGLVLGLKHASEVDHVVAVSSIVSEHRKLSRSALVGGLWGLGHTASLVAVGLVVLVSRVAIPESVASWLEFAVALMIIGLGFSSLVRVVRRRIDVHAHHHSHDGQEHVHVHFHEPGTEHVPETHNLTKHSHDVSRIGVKPFLVGAMHGLAGSAALTLLVVAQTESIWLGLANLMAFGLGSALGMLLMSSLIGLPFVLSGRRLSGLNYGFQTVAGCLTIVFGLWYAFQSGVLRTP